MSKLIYNKILAKLEKLDEYLGYLTKLKKASKKQFLVDFYLYGTTERYLQLAIEVVLDISKLLIVSENLQKPEDNQDMFAVLKDAKIITPKLAGSFMGICGFRNILVHEYAKIDRAIVYQKLQKSLKQFRDFKSAILRFLL